MGSGGSARPRTEEIIRQHSDVVTPSVELTNNLNGMFDKVEDINNQSLINFKDQVPAYYLRNGTFQTYDRGDVVSGIMEFVNSILQPALNPSNPANDSYFRNNNIDLKGAVARNALEVAKSVQSVMQKYANEMVSQSSNSAKQQNQVLTLQNNVFACSSVFFYKVDIKRVFTGFSIKIIYSNTVLQNLLLALKISEAIQTFLATAGERARQREEKKKLIQIWEERLKNETDPAQRKKISDFIETQRKLLDDVDSSKLIDTETHDITTGGNSSQMEQNRDQATNVVSPGVKPFPNPPSSNLPPANNLPDDF